VRGQSQHIQMTSCQATPTVRLCILFFETIDLQLRRCTMAGNARTIVFVLLNFQYVISFSSPRRTRRSNVRHTCLSGLSASPTWSDIESMLGSSFASPRPVVIDSVLQPDKPTFSMERPTLFRERHGWCPYRQVGPLRDKTPSILPS
jgi:hypothetical protein